MRLLPALLTALPVLAGAALAQTDTFPRGYLTTEGDSAAVSVLGYRQTGTYNTSYFAQVDNTQKGYGARSLKSLYLRRDGAAVTNASYESRFLTVTVRMAHADWTKVVNGGENADATYRQGAWTTVLNAKKVWLPDLSIKPATAPALFSIQLPLDAAFAYSGQSALAMQVQCSPNNLSKLADYPLDAVSISSTQTVGGAKLGVSCTPTGTLQPLDHTTSITSHGLPGMVGFQIMVGGAPVSVPTLAWIGATGLDLSFGGCTKLYATPQILLNGTPANSQGFGNVALRVPNQPAYQGLVFYTQMAILDVKQPGLPFALSNGRRTVFPTNPTNQPQFANGLVFGAAGSWPTSQVLAKGQGVVVGFGQ